MQGHPGELPCEVLSNLLNVAEFEKSVVVNSKTAQTNDKDKLTFSSCYTGMLYMSKIYAVELPVQTQRK